MMYHMLVHPKSSSSVRVSDADEHVIMHYALLGYRNAALEQLPRELQERSYTGVRSKKGWVRLAQSRRKPSPRRRRSSSTRRRRRVRHGRYL